VFIIDKWASWLQQKQYKKFWEELIAYFPLIDTDRVKRRVQEFYYCCMRIRWRGNVFTEPWAIKIFFRNTESKQETRKRYFVHVIFEVHTAVVMKSSIFWNITPCSPLKVNWRFGGTRSRACHQLSRWFLARLIFRPWRWRRNVPLKRRLTLNSLQGVISLKTELFKRYFVHKNPRPKGGGGCARKYGTKCSRTWLLDFVCLLQTTWLKFDWTLHLFRT
jgi:hypothetical protein